LSLSLEVLTSGPLSLEIIHNFSKLKPVERRVSFDSGGRFYGFAYIVE